MTKEEEAKAKESLVLQYVKAAASSSDRARTVIIVMVTTSVLVFVGVWNAKPGIGGWMDRRIEIRRDALKFFIPEDAAAGTLPLDPRQDPNLTAADRQRYEHANKYIQNNHFNTVSPADRKQIVDEIAELRRIRTEKFRLIQMPFFGAVIDMNDMGIFAGITFVIVLLWFRYSLSRQLYNFRLAFKEAADMGQLKLCYDLLAMQQVLTLPPAEGQKRSRIWVAIPKLLFLIPLVILVLHLLLNWISRQNGYLLSVKLMNLLLIVNVVTVVLAAILSWQALSLSWQLDKTWKEAAEKVYPETAKLLGNK